MSTIESIRRSREEVARIGDEILRQRIEPKLDPVDMGKYVAIDVDSGEYEIDPNDYRAIHRLKGRLPSADIWLAKAGAKSAYKMVSLR